MIENNKSNSQFNTKSAFNSLFMLFKALVLPIAQLILFLNYYNKNLNAFLIGSSLVIIVPPVLFIRESSVSNKPLLSLYYDYFTKELYDLNVFYKISFFILVISNLFSIVCFIYYFYKN